MRENGLVVPCCYKARSIILKIAQTHFQEEDLRYYLVVYTVQPIISDEFFVSDDYRITSNKRRGRSFNF